MGKEKGLEKPTYCKGCNKCKTGTTVLKNLKVVRNTGWTHDIYCEKLKCIVYRM